MGQSTTQARYLLKYVFFKFLCSLLLTKLSHLVNYRPLSFYFRLTSLTRNSSINFMLLQAIQPMRKQYVVSYFFQCQWLPSMFDVQTYCLFRVRICWSKTSLVVIVFWQVPSKRRRNLCGGLTAKNNEGYSHNLNRQVPKLRMLSNTPRAESLHYLSCRSFPPTPIFPVSTFFQFLHFSVVFLKCVLFLKSRSYDILKHLQHKKTPSAIKHYYL